MSNLSKRNLKGGKSSRKRVQSRKSRKQRGGALSDDIFAKLLSTLYNLEKNTTGNNDFPDIDNLLNGCSITQLGIVYSIVKTNQNKVPRLYSKVIELIEKASNKLE
jgi:hypothetical protein